MCLHYLTTLSTFLYPLGLSAVRRNLIQRNTHLNSHYADPTNPLQVYTLTLRKIATVHLPDAEALLIIDLLKIELYFSDLASLSIIYLMVSWTMFCASQITRGLVFGHTTYLEQYFYAKPEDQSLSKLIGDLFISAKAPYDKMCAICRNEFLTPVRIICLYIFCESCARTLFAHSDVRPLCREKPKGWRKLSPIPSPSPWKSICGFHATWKSACGLGGFGLTCCASHHMRVLIAFAATFPSCSAAWVRHWLWLISGWILDRGFFHALQAMLAVIGCYIGSVGGALDFDSMADNAAV